MPQPPVGDGWPHEVKFDGYRIQLHKFPRTVLLYSKGGRDFRRKFSELADAVAELHVRPVLLVELMRQERPSAQPAEHCERSRPSPKC